MAPNSPRPEVNPDASDTTVFPAVNNTPAAETPMPHGVAMPEGAPAMPEQPTGYVQQGYAPYGQPMMQPGAPMMAPGMPGGYPVEKKNNTGLIVGIIIAVVALLVVAAVIFFGDAFGLRTKLTGGSDEVVTSTVVVDEITPVAPVVEAPAAPKIQPQAGWRRCGSGYGMGVYAGTGATSCPFAMNVYNSLGGSFSSSYKTVNVYSPVTGYTYTMSCSNNGGWFTCTGGNNAVVQIIPE